MSHSITTTHIIAHAYNLAAIGDFTVSEIVVGDFARAYIFRLQRRALQGLNFYIASAHGSEPIPCEHTSLFKLNLSLIKTQPLVYVIKLTF